uniref:Uncharacterized protein n=1 Tax=Timema genevievae TaxID=629358 RepID=A0A7R9PH27_TIMGE|nr:unnamed protein product [Timema genevievae]
MYPEKVGGDRTPPQPLKSSLAVCSVASFSSAIVGVHCVRRLHRHSPAMMTSPRLDTCVVELRPNLEIVYELRPTHFREREREISDRNYHRLMSTSLINCKLPQFFSFNGFGKNLKDHQWSSGDYRNESLQGHRYGSKASWEKKSTYLQSLHTMTSFRVLHPSPLKFPSSDVMRYGPDGNGFLRPVSPP